ncbi:hypothetical protein AC578_2902 [Pseudocercospora eumusae]|uniref:Uncharacterized protein n=1 Tax=Pseudocercospora eumusae TaxID=321146 RepID=A0A139H3T2_9PEZI|nr:hypothetical protein AC578_2902 [Pseudocercospora eumusae]
MEPASLPGWRPSWDHMDRDLWRRSRTHGAWSQREKLPIQMESTLACSMPRSNGKSITRGLCLHLGPQSVPFRPIAEGLQLALLVCFWLNVLEGKPSIDYGPQLYANPGHGVSASLIIQAGWISWGIIGNSINAILIDKVGRKWLMVTSVGDRYGGTVTRM